MQACAVATTLNVNLGAENIDNRVPRAAAVFLDGQPSKYMLQICCYSLTYTGERSMTRAKGRGNIAGSDRCLSCTFVFGEE